MAKRIFRFAAVVRSLSVQGIALLAILIILPVLLYSIFTRIENERRALLLTAVRDAGVAIGNGLAPELEHLQPADFGTLETRLARFADPRRQIVLLFHPTDSVGETQFYFVASVPAIPASDLDRERAQLAALGVLDRLAHSCSGGTPLTERVPSSNGSAVITSLTGIAGQTGCWAIVIAVNIAGEMAGIADRSAEVRQELRLALLIYVVMAALILAIFGAVWTNLRRFRNRALTPGSGGFLAVTDVPEMVPVARAIDAMVNRLHETANLLRQAAEDNAHAFKGPIATIRQAIEPLLAATPESTPTAAALAAARTALDRLDGLVRSVRRIDAATADLLEISRARVDISALLHELVADCRVTRAGQHVAIVENIAPNVIVLGESDAIESIFENLLDNALDFSPEHGTVQVTLKIDGAMATTTVEDTGPGVAESTLPRIFERYYSDRRAMPRDKAQAPQSTHFGVGLWIARQNARALGGDITAKNRIPHGLCVSVRLPLAETTTTPTGH